MTDYSFDTIVGQSIAFDQDADELNIAYGADTVTFTQNGSDLVVTVAGVGSVTLLGTTIGELVGSAAAGDDVNISVASGALLVGDNTSSDALDSLANVINGGAGNDLLYGMGGADTIDGMEGDDIIFGGTGITDTTDGADMITTGTGNVTVYGNAGNDDLDIGATASGNTALIYGGLGNDDVDSGAIAGTASVLGQAGADDINVSMAVAGSTVNIFGGVAVADSTDGGDTITLGVGSAVVYGNGGNDTIDLGAHGASETVFVNAGIGADDLDNDGVNFAGATTLSGGWGDDDIDVNSTAATSLVVYGGNGLTDANTSEGADNIDIVDGGALATAMIYGNAGDDTINYDGSDNTVTATALINGGLGNDTVTATGSANDTITINTGAGDDTVTVTTGANDSSFIINGYDTSDTLTVNFNNSTAADMTVATGSSSTVIDDSGNEGAVVLNGYTGNLNLVMNDGTVLKSNTTATAETLTGSANTGDQLISGAAGDTFSFTAAQYDNGVDALTGGAGSDTLLITEGAETINDFSLVSGVDSILYGTGAAADNQLVDLTAAAGDLTLIDGSNLTTGTLGVSDSADAGADLTVEGGAAVETVDLSSQTGSLTINGNAGADALTGGTSTDVINGGEGADNINGNGGNDTIDGGAGADTITGGAGVESLTGGTGADDFVFTAAQSGQTLATVDVITDFNADEDQITFQAGADFSDSTGVDTSGDANLLAAANTAVASAIGGAATNWDAAGDVVEFVFGGRTFVVVNDGANAVTDANDLIVDITGFTGTLDAADFN